jgi:hypothetical protein
MEKMDDVKRSATGVDRGQHRWRFPVNADMEYVSNEDRARGKQPKQRIDDAIGLLQWKVTVSDPSADKDRDKSISVIMLDKGQPVPQRLRSRLRFSTGALREV